MRIRCWVVLSLLVGVGCGEASLVQSEGTLGEDTADQSREAGLSSSAILATAASGVGFSYWWGHGRWQPGSGDRGACYGSCPSCSHRGGSGADCSGFVAKAWRVPEWNNSVSDDAHPYTTWHFENQSDFWRRVSRFSVVPGDVLVQNNSSGGHMFIYERGDPWGMVWSYESRGCRYPIAHNLRSIPSGYKAIRRNGLSASGSAPTAATGKHTVAVVASPTGGYWLASAEGGVFSYGGAAFHGSAANLIKNAPVVGLAATPDGGGYWLASADGGIFAFGNARFHGSMGGTTLNRPIVAIVSTPDGNGYWMVASDGGLFAFGNAPYLGSMGGTGLNAPIVGMARTSNGGGYWMVASDGGLFAFGNAPYLGSMAGSALKQPVTGIAARPDGAGYWLVAADGGMFAFGAPFLGGMAHAKLNAGVVAITSSPSGGGYWLVGADGGVFAFGDARFSGAQ